MAKNVEIIITAEDKASGKLVNTARNLEKTNKQIVETGRKSKASNEALAQFLSLFGQGELAGASGALTSIGDKFGEMNGEIEGAKVQALAFKGVVAIGVFAAAVSVGKAIGDWILQTEKANKELERSKELAKDLADRIAQANQRKIGEEVAEVQQIADLEERRAAALELQSRIGSNIESKNAQIARLTKEIEEREAGILGWTKAWSGEYKQTTEIKKQELEQAKQLREVMREQNQQLLEISAGERDRLEAEQKQVEAAERKKQTSADYLTQLEKELELLKSQDKVATQIKQNEQLTDADRGKALSLAREIEAEKHRQEQQKQAQREAEQAAKQQAAEQKKLLEEQARERERLAKAMASPTTLQSTESRLLTRGDGHDLAKQTAEATKKSAEELQKQTSKLEEIKHVINGRPAEEVRRERELQIVGA